MKSLFRRIRIVSLVVMIISILFCCGYVYAAESIAQTFVLSEENEIKGVNRNIDYIKKSDSEHMTDAVLDVFDVSENGDMILGFTDGYMNAYNQNGEFIFGLKIDNSKAYYYFQFHGDNILVSSMRSRRVYELTRDGEVCKVWNKIRVDRDAESRLIQYLEKPSRTMNGYTYERSAYPSQFVRISPDGERQVIYKAPHIYPIGGLLYFLFFTLVGLHVFWSLGKGHFKTSHYGKNNVSLWKSQRNVR
ncbi:hypothetical protein LK537_13920 [Lachnoclostridium pacaense]|nr:hypothetical protein [Lachnoclostridium pacaense]MCC2818392.1 hypothetical protein [Lachnoclostridium pacaense]